MSTSTNSATGLEGCPPIAANASSTLGASVVVVPSNAASSASYLALILLPASTSSLPVIFKFEFNDIIILAYNSEISLQTFEPVNVFVETDLREEL